MLKKSCRDFFFPHVGAQQPLLCNPRVNYGSNGSSGKRGRLRSSSWKVKSAKGSPHSIFCKELGAILEYQAMIACHYLEYVTVLSCKFMILLFCPFLTSIVLSQNVFLILRIAKAKTKK